MDDTFKITIEGLWREGARDTYPQYPGIFFVFEAKKDGRKLVPLKLVYVGAAGNVREGILSFMEQFNFPRYIRLENTVCFLTAQLNGQMEAQRILGAYIYAHKPPANDQYKYTFPFPDTRILSEGVTCFLKDDFRI